MPCRGLYLYRSINHSKIERNFEFYNSIQRRMPNIPVFGWLSRSKNMTDTEGISCSKYPFLTDLHYRNKYWQIFKFSDQQSNWTLDVMFHLYGAYFDNRTIKLGPMIRIISMVHSRFVVINSIYWNKTTQLKFSETILREAIKKIMVLTSLFV